MGVKTCDFRVAISPKAKIGNVFGDSFRGMGFEEVDLELRFRFRNERDRQQRAVSRWFFLFLVEHFRLTCPLDCCAGYSLSGREKAKPEKQSTRTD